MSNNYVELKVSELRDECKSRNLDTTGLKVHLVERLNKYDREQLIKSKSEINLPVSVIKEDSKSEAKSEAVSLARVGVHAQNAISMDNENLKMDFTDDKTNAERVSKEDRKRPYPSDESIVPKTHKLDLFKLASKEVDNWENRTDIHLDFYNSDMNIAINEDGYSATSLNKDGFEYMCAGVKANYGIKSGKVYYEVKVLKRIKVDVNSDAGESNFIRIGWSTDNESLALGEGKLSFAYDWLGKKINDENHSEYGMEFDEESVVGCFVEFHGDSFVIQYSVNGVNQGVAYNVPSRDLKDNMLIPHIYVKNVAFEVNFGQSENESCFPPQTVVDENKTVEDMTWTLFSKVNLNQRFRALKPPKSKSECEVLMMCGLPSCGKTHWTDMHIKKHYEKRYNVLSINTVLEKMKVINLRKKVSTDRWESFISSATHCLNKLLEIAVSRRRNFILDQTNVYPSAQRRRMKPFEEFIRKAIIIVPTDDEYQRRMNQVIQEEGKDVPESAVLQLKENFVIPEENSELFNEIMFIELQRPEAGELIKKYNEEARNLKKKESNSDSKSKEDSDEDNFGKWATSPKSCTEDNEKSAPKKSRWNDQIENKKESRSRDRHDRSPEKLSRKNDYKGGFCFSREASDSGRGSRSNDGNYRSEDRHSEKPKDQRADRSGNRSGMYRKPADNNDRKPRFDSRDDSRDDSRFGNRNSMGGGRDSRPRDRGNDSRGGGLVAGRDRPRGGFNDRRRQLNSYGNDNDQIPRSKFPQNTYNDRNAIGASTYPNQDRNSRFPQNNNTERNNFRGIGSRGSSAGGNQSSMYGNEFRNAPDTREFSHYSEFNPHGDQNRQSNKPWQQDFKSEGMADNSRRPPHSYENQTGNSNRNNQMGANYDQQYGGPQVNRGPMSGTVNSRGGKGGDQLSSIQYSDRKQMFTGSRGGTSGNRGGRSSLPLMDASPVDDYSYGSKSYMDQTSKFGNKSPYSGDAPKGNSYKEHPRQDVYNNAKPPHIREGGYSRFGDSAKVVSQCDTKSMDNTPREFPGMPHSNSTTNQYDNYQSYDNSQYNQSQGYYNYYTSDSGKESQGPQASSTYPSANTASRQPYSNSSYQPSGATTFQSSTQLPHQQQAPSNINSSTGYQSSAHASGGTGYQSANYQSSNPAGGAGGYQSNYQTGATTYQSNYPTTDPASGAGYPPISNPSAVNSYTNPYNAIYDNISSYNSTYYGQNNTYTQSSSYGDSTVPSKFGDFGSKPPASDRVMQPPPIASAPPVSASGPPSTPTGQTQTNWGTGYGNDFNQYYGQYYGQ